MTNFDMITLCNLIRNKDLQGEDVTVTEYQALFNAQSQLLFSDKIGSENEYQLNAPIARRGAGLSRKISEELRPFLKKETKTIAGGSFSLNSLAETVGYLLAVAPTTITGRGFIELEPDDVADLQGSAVVSPTAKDPAFEWVSSTAMSIYPSTITSITVTYYKKPDDCVIVTTTNATTLLEEYVSASSTEFEWEDRGKLEIVYRSLRELGVNIERSDVFAMGEKITQER